MISKSEFLNRVHGSIFPLLKKMEQERVAVLKKWVVGMIVLDIVLTAAAGIGIGLMSEWNFVLIITIVLPLGIAAYKSNVFSHQLKEKFIPLLYSLINLKNKTQGHETRWIDFEALLNKGLFGSNSHLWGYDDHFCAQDNSFFVEEIKAIEGSGRNRTVVFDGFVFEMPTNVKLKQKILILQKLNLLSPKRFKPKKSLGYQEMTMNDAVFDERFQVYTKDENETKCVLNKMLLRHILSLHDIYPKAIINLFNFVLCNMVFSN